MINYQTLSSLQLGKITEIPHSRVSLTLSLTAMYFDPISSRSALVAASKSSKRFTSDWSIRDSSPKPGDAILESTGEIDFVTMSRIFVGTVGLLAPGSPFKCWSSNLCEKKKTEFGVFWSKSPQRTVDWTAWTWLARIQSGMITRSRTLFKAFFFFVENCEKFNLPW